MLDAANQRINEANKVRSQEGKPSLPYFSLALENYRLNFAVIGGEISAKKPITGNMGARFREWNIFIQQ